MNSLSSFTGLGWLLAIAVFVLCLGYLLFGYVRLWWLRRVNRRLTAQINLRCMALIEELRTGVAETVMIYQPNDDEFCQDDEQEMVCINGEWTGFEDRNFSGQTLLEALTNAVRAKRQAGWDALKKELNQPK